MFETVVIRPIERRDYDKWLPLWDGYNAFYGRSGSTALPGEITATTWNRFFDAYEPVNALVAEIDEARMTVSRPPNLTSAIRQWLFGRALGG